MSKYDYEETQQWSRIETKQALEILDRLYVRVMQFGPNLDENTLKCLDKIEDIAQRGKVHVRDAKSNGRTES